MEKERELKLYVEKLKERIAKGIFAEITEMRENYLRDDALKRGIRLSKLRARRRALLMVERKGKWIAKILRRKWKLEQNAQEETESRERTLINHKTKSKGEKVKC